MSLGQQPYRKKKKTPVAKCFQFILCCETAFLTVFLLLPTELIQLSPINALSVSRHIHRKV